MVRRSITKLCTGVAIWLLPAAGALADEVIADDVVINANLIVSGSLCVGPVCADNENFGFDTMRLKSSVPLIRLQDTSTAAAFPTTDWMLGLRPVLSQPPVFVIDDLDAGSSVLQLESGAAGGVAIGADAVLEPGAVSVGAPGTERRVVHVAPGVAATDAVNMAQFDAFKDETTSNTAGDAAALNARLDTIEADVDALDARIDALTTRIDNL